MNGVARPSEHDAGRAIRSTQSPLEFELMVKNPVAYPALRHVPLTTLERDGLLRPSRLRRSKSVDYQYNGLRQHPSPNSKSTAKLMDGLPTYENDDEEDDDDDNNNDMFHLDAPSSRTSDESRYPVPFLCDERLRDLKISYWTDVSVTDDYAARVISLYLMLRDGCPHHVIILHIWFHAAILDIFRPFIRISRHERLRLKTFNARYASPDAAFNASVGQLKQLIVRYRCSYASSAYTLLWQSALIYVANAVLHDTQNPEWRFYFLACIYGYESLRKPYRIAEVITRGLLTMTLRDGDITGTEARHLLKHIREAETNHEEDDVRATFMVDLDLAMTDPDAARVENLAKRFEDIALFREFTT
ncbi:hypothetical protein QIS74_03469 [Colletotrichum tabaci]|uniref:Uncharacterized protein n=1 Tax=Colletotrichum tabaci TaxID=1209068 RepID=A0AAV9TKC9_9PEZI